MRAQDAGAESAVSAVVGAVLLMGLFASVMTVYVVQTLPDWKADKEQAHQLSVAQTLGTLKTDVEALAARRDTAPASASIPLEVPRVALLQSEPARAGLSIDDAAFALDFTFPAGARLFSSDGSMLATPDSTAFCSGACIASFQDLVVGVVATGATAELSRTITLTDGAGDTLSAQVSLFDETNDGGNCPGELRLTVAGQVSTTSTLLCTGDTPSVGTQSAFRIDLLDPLYGFASGLARMEAPFTWALGGSTGGGTMTLTTASVYEDDAGVLRTTGTGAATAAAPLQDLAGSDVLTYAPSYQAFPNQALLYEGGAVLTRAGGTRQAVTGEPSLSFDVDATGEWGSLAWTLVDLQGNGGVAGSSEATVSVTYGSTEDAVLVLPASACTASVCATFAFTTDTTQAWTSHVGLEADLAGAGTGVDVAAASFSLRAGAGLDVTQGWVVHLRIIHATVAVS